MEKSRLYRSYKNTVIGGVCGGLGEYLDTDPVLFRILFVVAFLVGGTGLLAYIILWIVIPLEEIPKVSRAEINEESSNSNTMEEEKNNIEIEKDNMEEQKKQAKNDGNLWGGLILITLGAIFLIDRFVPRIDFGDLWPLILIVVGVILISKNYQNPKK
jgi:phage shock protein PspC (stress-responsive transcriptional regulator)